MAFNYRKYRAAQFETPNKKSPFEAGKALETAQSAWKGIKESKVGKLVPKVGKFLGMNTPMGRAIWTLDLISPWLIKTLPDPQKQLKKRAETETKGGSQYTSPKL